VGANARFQYIQPFHALAASMITPPRQQHVQRGYVLPSSFSRI
jgi:hypothetical protein